MKCKYCGKEILDNNFIDLSTTKCAHKECFDNYLNDLDELQDFLDYDYEEVTIGNEYGVWSYLT